MKIEILSVCNQLLASAANGIYQGIIIAAFVALTLRWFGRTNAATRHAIWFCTLLVLVSLLVAHLLIGSGLFSPAATKTDVMAALNPGLDTFPPVVDAGQNQAERTGTDLTASVASWGYRTPSPEETMEKSDSPPLPLTQAVASEARGSSAGDLSFQRGKLMGNEPGNAEYNGEELAPKASGETAGFRWLVQRLASPVSLKLALGSKIPGIAGLILLSAWLMIASFRVLALLWQLAGIQKLKYRLLPPGAGSKELFEKLIVHLEVNRKVELKLSPVHQSSFLLGFLHPVILLPAEQCLKPAEAELVLRHELAHLRRYDDWANLLQQFILAMFVFHPSVWWVSRQLSLEREIACDDHVLQQSGPSKAYALLLANLAARMQRGLPQLSPGSSNNKTQLKERIDMILNKHRNTSPRLAKTWLAFITSTMALMAVATICSAPRIVLAQNETAPADANAPSADAPSVALASGGATATFAADAADSDPVLASPRTSPQPVAVGAGPKFKSGNSGYLNAPPIVLATPAVDLAPTPVPKAVAAPVPPTPILAAIEPAHEAQAPHPPRSVRAPYPGNRDASLEERLERLERMVESLVNQQNPGGDAFHLKAGKDGMIDRKEIAKIEAFAKRQAEFSKKQMLDAREIERIKEQAERTAARAVEQAKRATADAGKAVHADQKRQSDRKLKEQPQRQIEALRKQLEILERQKEKLDHQIEHLEQNQEELDEQRDEDGTGSDTQLDEFKAERETQPPPAP